MRIQNSEFRIQNGEMDGKRLQLAAYGLWLAAFLCLPPSAFLHAADLKATAAIQPSEINMDEAAQLSIAIEGATSSSPPALPVMDGLDIQYIGPSTQFSFINGTVFQSVTYNYQVTSRREGSFTIPGIKIKVGDKMLETDPVNLKVEKSAGGTPSPNPPTGLLPVPSPNPYAVPNQAEPPVAASEYAAVQLIYPKRDFYVGEMAPVDLKVLLRSGLNVTQVSLPTLSGNAFAVGKIGDKPQETQEVIHGNLYHILTWHTTFAAVKAGDHPLGAEIQCTLVVRTRSQRHLFGSDLFNDDFFDNFFGGAQQVQKTLRSREETVKILPLPMEGQPSDFSGAVGKFKLSASAMPSQVSVGDPVTLKMTVQGEGNFDRVSSPTLENTEGWKTYAPGAKFEPSDEAGYVGQKVFEQVIIPQKAEIKNVPPLKFSYFDPESKKYAMLASDAIPLQVSGVSLSPAPSISPSAAVGWQSSTPPSTLLLPHNSLEEMVPNKMRPGRLQHGMGPVILQPWFWGLQSIPILALALTWAFAWRRDHLVQDPLWARNVSASRAVRDQLNAMKMSLHRQDTPAFFAASRRALQERLAEKWGIKPESIALSDIENHFPEKNLLLEKVRKVFEAADHVAYSGQAFNSQTLKDWQKTILETLKELEKK